MKNNGQSRTPVPTGERKRLRGDSPHPSPAAPPSPLEKVDRTPVPTVEEVKRDLRRLRKLSHAIEAELKVRESHERRLTYLRSIEDPGEDVLIDIMRTEDAISSLRVDAHIREAAELEGRYMDAISSLEPLDRAIIIDGYVNGKAYWKIGRDIGYTERGIQKRVTVAIEKIAAAMK